MGAPASTPGQILNYTPGVDYVGSQNLLPPPLPGSTPPPLLWLCEVYSASRIYLSLPEYTPFSTNICDPPRIYSLLPEYTPPFQQLYATLPKSTPPSQNIGPTLLFNNSMRPSQDLPPPSKNIPPFSTTICDPPRFYPSLPECTPFSMSTICDPPTIYPSLSEYTPLGLFNNYMRPSQNLLIPPRIYPHFQQLQDYATPPPQNLPLPPRIFFSSGSKW